MPAVKDGVSHDPGQKAPHTPGQNVGVLGGYGRRNSRALTVRSMPLKRKRFRSWAFRRIGIPSSTFGKSERLGLKREGRSI